MHPSPAPQPESSLPLRRRLSSDDRRRQLIENAIDLFSRHGFSGTRTKDIAAASGVSEAILFRHFATKEDLYRAILDMQHSESSASQWLEEMRALAERRDDAGVVRCLIARILKSFRENAPFHRLMLFASLDGHALADLFHQRLGLPTFEFLSGYFAQRQKEGAFRPGDPGLAVLFAMSAPIQFAMSRHLFGKKWVSMTDEELVPALAELVLCGVQVPAGLPSDKKKVKRGRS